VIAPDGHALASTGFFEPAYLDNAVRLKSNITFATDWGPVIRWVLVGIGLAAVIAAMLHNGRFVRRRRRTPSGPQHGPAGQDSPGEGSEDEETA
jgi:apolipoprotein N-acyltransferase